MIVPFRHSSTKKHCSFICTCYVAFHWMDEKMANSKNLVGGGGRGEPKCLMSARHFIWRLLFPVALLLFCIACFERDTSASE
jgi:hypothetical protein